MKFYKEAKTYNLNFNLKDDPDMVWKLASFPSTYLLNFPELIELRSESTFDPKMTVLHQMAFNCLSWPEEERNKLIDFIFELPDFEKFTNSHGDTPLHKLASRGITRVLEHPLYNSSLNSSMETPYCLLLEKVKTKELESCIRPQEVLKILHKPKYGSSKMPLDHIEKRSFKPTLGQLHNWGIPILSDKKQARKKLGYSDISEFKKNNALRFILA